MKSTTGKRYTVLVVEDEPLGRDLMRLQLERAGFRVLLAETSKEALHEAITNSPDIILLDIVLPDGNGLDVLRKLREERRTHLMPVLLVTALSDTEDIVNGLAEGASDYITKPINFPVLLARMHTHLRLAQTIAQVETQRQVLERLAAIDELTGVYNRRSLFEALEAQVYGALRYSHPLSLLMLDIDHFKKVNDEYGHPAGDAVLRGFARRALEQLRLADVFARYGGEEFCVVLPETGQEGAELVAERLRQAIAEAPFETPEGMLSVTVSIGGVTLPPNEADASHALTVANQLIASADAALYESKNCGRNRVTLARTLLSATTVTRPRTKA